MKLIKTKQITNEKYLNLYTLTYEKEKGKEINWTIASRFKKESLTCLTKKVVPNAVSIIPTLTIDNEPAIIITKEFRFPINDYVYSFPAGLIEENEDVITTSRRELYEEIGATKLGSIKILGTSYNSEGMSDESATTVEVEVLELKEQHLQDNEDIKYEVVKIKDLENYIKNKKISVRLQFVAHSYIKEYKLRKESEKK